MAQCKTVVLKVNLDEGLPGPEHFDIQSSDAPAPLGDGDDGAVIVEAMAMSADPYLRGQIKPNGGITAGSPMKGFIAGKIVDSKSERFVIGDLVGASLPFCTKQKVTAEMMATTAMWKLTGLLEEKDISLGVGVLGMPGSTAYGGLVDVLACQEGQTVFVSAAAGAVGGLVGQIAKNVYNCTVVGSAGGPEKCALVKEKYGFDHCIDYKTCTTAEDLIAKLKECVPKGIDMYFENVGGIHFDAAMATLRPHGRVAVCGAISQYNEAKPVFNNLRITQMIYSFQRIEGFMCLPWLSGKKGKFLEDMSKWLKEDKLKVQETFYDGIDQWPTAFQALFTGANKGKVVVRV